MIENPPEITERNALPPPILLKILSNPKNHNLLSKIEKEYLYWDKIKYLGTKELPSEVLWQTIKFSRLAYANFVNFGDYSFIFKISNYMQQLLHEFDMNFGGTLSGSTTISEKYTLS